MVTLIHTDPDMDIYTYDEKLTQIFRTIPGRLLSLIYVSLTHVTLYY